MYTVPNEYAIRLHHVRPRFKNDIENVLIYMATEISKIDALPAKEFSKHLTDVIFKYPGNTTKTIKTINNWRTEIPSLFGFVIPEAKEQRPGRRAIELANNGDLVESFKKFLFSFQYPGGHNKAYETLSFIQKGVRFKPAKTILAILQVAEKETGARAWLSKAEVCHLIFNDLRCVTGLEKPKSTWKRILNNRKNNVKYNTRGDIIRYAGDIIDYMEIANLLVSHDGKHYYMNKLEMANILKFINSKEWFMDYDNLQKSESITLKDVKVCTTNWFRYVNRDLSKSDFSTDILSYISEDEDDYQDLKNQSIELFNEKLDDKHLITTKDIGDMGEGMIYAHECQRVKSGNRLDLIHLIQRIPTKFAVGYDIQSVELNEEKRYIEVKTTISMKPLKFNKIKLTTNEWNTAKTMGDRYFIYRLAISKFDKKLFVIQNPVYLYKQDLIDMTPKDGAEITFDVKKSGEFKELLTWSN